MSDVEVTYAEPVTRKETARTLSALAAALGDAGKVELTLGHTRMTVRVPDEVRCKVEVEIDGDEVEFEVELRWSTRERARLGRPEAPGEENGGRRQDGDGAEPSPDAARSDASEPEPAEPERTEPERTGPERTGSESAGSEPEPARRSSPRRKAGAR
ncbi:amphi-Trp domain-containing protein [Pseudonocardia lutea]|uniref:Amphi-Trp domain-containing protein n=1 Tax=Pseudonocardia lutea TaxID=2172015 RepID=A0ABW1I3W1_9PSEU